MKKGRAKDNCSDCGKKILVKDSWFYIKTEDLLMCEKCFKKWKVKNDGKKAEFKTTESNNSSNKRIFC